MAANPAMAKAVVVVRSVELSVIAAAAATVSVVVVVTGAVVVVVFGSDAFCCS